MKWRNINLLICYRKWATNQNGECNGTVFLRARQSVVRCLNHWATYWNFHLLIVELQNLIFNYMLKNVFHLFFVFLVFAPKKKVIWVVQDNPTFMLASVASLMSLVVCLLWTCSDRYRCCFFGGVAFSSILFIFVFLNVTYEKLVCVCVCIYIVYVCVCSF